jgi:hypothetical protein
LDVPESQQAKGPKTIVGATEPHPVGAVVHTAEEMPPEEFDEAVPTPTKLVPA